MGNELLSQAFASTAVVLSGVSKEQLDEATPCALWQVRDLVNHIVGGTGFFATVAETGEPPAGAEAPDFADGDFVAAFREGAARVVRAFDAEGVMEKTMNPGFAVLPGSAFVNIATVDTFAHGWDLAKATGQATDLDPALAEQLLAIAQASLPDAFRGPEGQAPFGIQVDAPAGACAADQLAAFLGRRP